MEVLILADDLPVLILQLTISLEMGLLGLTLAKGVTG